MERGWGGRVTLKWKQVQTLPWPGDQSQYQQ